MWNLINKPFHIQTLKIEPMTIAFTTESIIFLKPMTIKFTIEPIRF